MQNTDAVTFGFRNFFAEKFKNVFFMQKFVRIVSIFSRRMRDSNPSLNTFFIGQTVDKLFSVGFYNGYTERKAEELTELIITPPYNRISKN